MSLDFNAPEGERPSQDEASLFAPTPIWARDRQPRRGRRAAAPSAARDRRSGVSAAAIAAGVAAAAILAGAGWYASQRQSQGVAELTPGRLAAPAATQTALATKAPPGAGALPITRVSDPAATPSDAAAEPAAPPRHRGRARATAPNAHENAMDTSTAEPLPRTPATQAGTAAQTETTNLNPLAGTTSPVPPASTPSASSAEPGSSPAATPSPVTTP